jgi:hypothetical protein
VESLDRAALTAVRLSHATFQAPKLTPRNNFRGSHLKSPGAAPR